MPERLHAYLSGGMEYAKGEGVEWRIDLEAWLGSALGHTAFNPNKESRAILECELPGRDFRKLKFDDIGEYVRVMRLIVERDVREIARRTDYVVCLWDKAAQAGAGTKGELSVARYFGKPVYLVTAMSMPEIPGWILGCATRTLPSFGSLKSFLRKSYGRGGSRTGSGDNGGRRVKKSLHFDSPRRTRGR